MIEKLKRIALSSKVKFQKSAGCMELQSVMEGRTQGGLEEGDLGGMGSLRWDGGRREGGSVVVDKGAVCRGSMTGEPAKDCSLVMGQPSESLTEEVGVESSMVETVVVKPSVKKWQRCERVERGEGLVSSELADNVIINENKKRTRADDVEVWGGQEVLLFCGRKIFMWCFELLLFTLWISIYGHMIWNGGVRGFMGGRQCRTVIYLGSYSGPLQRIHELRAWLCVGVFNEVLFTNEMKGGSRAQRQMNNFRDAVDVCELSDLGFEGYGFTFDNGQAGVDNRQCRLDRAFSNEGWRELFPYAKVINMSREWSDHSPIKVVLDGCEGLDGTRMRRFCFEQIWMGEDGCEDTIKKTWEEEDWNVVDTIARCAREMKKWKGVSIGKIMRDLSRKRKQLEWLNMNERTVENEEIFWRQRSRALWLKEGDRNTKYYHRKAGQRKKKNRIGRVVVDGERVVTGDAGIKGTAVEFFSELFTSSQPGDFEELLSGVKDRVTVAMNKSFKAEYREVEVFEALQQMHPLKAPGSDGMNALFYQTYWHIVGPSVTRLVLRILNGSESPAIINSTHIVLIPKKKAPDKFTDYRPISLCNVLYKLVAKVLANRLKQFLGSLVSENQSAFTPGRLISDNILIAFEMFHYMKNARSGGGHMALKLDMAKAYDRVEWVFLEKVLLSMGFDGNWVGNVMRCVRIVSYEVLINGSPSEAFVPSRGLRQGDPLSPYLFILCAEVLSSMIRRKVEEGVLHGIRVAPLSPFISHLFFADDSIIFVKVSEVQARVVMDLLGKYERASGQLVSKEKTTVSFSKGTAAWRRDKVSSILGVQVVQQQGKYLGLPTVIGHSKQVLNKIVRDKLNNKMQGNNSSYTWRSICDTKHVLGFGARRRVGDGRETRVWLDPWIPGTSSRCVISPRGDFDLGMRVEELMVAGEAKWNRGKVEAMFLPFEAERVMNIRLS
ncbi:uncharacterized protein LOC141589915 [Silene latifolia]|uniref:uncharacterized protein LOC141589915 n=1 Tax=Silene latifolia TaxID=37657 RepID=UPI003D78175D